MLQPFELFDVRFISRLRNLKKRFLVSQTYFRAVNPMINETRTPVLLTDYDNHGMAKIHLNALKGDKYAAILDLESESHRKKLEEMLGNSSKYILYWSVVKDAAVLKKMIDQKYADNMRRYIERNTNWRIGRDATIRPNVEVTFGELFITLKYSGQQIRLKFEEIESA